MLAQASCRKASKPAPRLSFRICRLFAPQLVLGRVAVVHVVGRIRPGHVRQLTAQHPLEIGADRRVTAKQPVVTQDPEIARLGDCLLRQRRRLVVLGQAFLRARQQTLELALAKADQPEVEAQLRTGPPARAAVAPRPTRRSAPAGCPPARTHASAPRSYARARSPAPAPARASWPPCTRPCPAMIPLSPSTSTGLVQPNSRMLAAICATWASLVGARIAGIGDQLAQRPPGDRKIVHPQDLTRWR